MWLKKRHRNVSVQLQKSRDEITVIGLLNCNCGISESTLGTSTCGKWVRSKLGLPQQCPLQVLETYLEVLEVLFGTMVHCSGKNTAEALGNIIIIIFVSFVAFLYLLHFF